MRIWLAVIGLGLLVGCSSPAVRPADRWVARNGGVCEPDAGRIEQIAGRFEGMLTRPIKLIVMDREILRAFSFPSGEVIVTRGLLTAMSDDEVTAVVGHEVGHLLTDGHTSAPTALTGRPAGGDKESDADAASVKLLTAMNLPPTAMRTALEKVHATLPADSPMRSALTARIQLLP
jgi:hypothetical protein